MAPRKKTATTEKPTVYITDFSKPAKPRRKIPVKIDPDPVPLLAPPKRKYTRKATVATDSGAKTKAPKKTSIQAEVKKTRGKGTPTRNPVELLEDMLTNLKILKRDLELVNRCTPETPRINEVLGLSVQVETSIAELSADYPTIHFELVRRCLKQRK